MRESCRMVNPVFTYCFIAQPFRPRSTPAQTGALWLTKRPVDPAAVDLHKLPHRNARRQLSSPEHSQQKGPVKTGPTISRTAPLTCGVPNPTGAERFLMKTHLTVFFVLLIIALACLTVNQPGAFSDGSRRREIAGSAAPSR